MTPEPRSVRTPPPAFPPAPPGTGTGPEPGRGDGDEGASIVYRLLQEGLNDLAVIRTTLETLPMFPGDVELEAELSGIIADARQALRTRVDAIATVEPRLNLKPRPLDIRRRLAELLADLQSDTYCRDGHTFDAQIFNRYTELLFSLAC